MPIVLLILFVIWPMGSLPLILYEIFRGHRYAYVFFVILLALLSSYYIPYGDQFRYWLDFANVEDIGSFFESDEAYRRICIPFFLLYLVKILGGHFEHVRMLCVLIGIGACLSAYCHWLKRGSEPNDFKDDMQNAVLLLVALPFMVICHGYRQGMGVCFCFCAFYAYYLCGRKILGFLFTVLAIFSHPSFLFVPIVLWLSARVRFVGRFAVIISVVMLCASVMIDFIFERIEPFLPSSVRFLSEYLSSDGAWRDISELRNPLRNIGENVAKLLLFMLGLAIIRVQDRLDVCKHSDDRANRIFKYNNAVLCYFLVWCGFFSYYTISVRLSYALILLFAASAVFSVGVERGVTWIRQMALLFLTSVVVYNGRNYVHLFRHLDYAELLTRNAVQYACHVYSDEYVNANVEDSGDFADEPQE